MAERMAWSSAKQAGFMLAALLADDRELHHVAHAIEPAQHAALLDAPDRHADKAQLVRTLLASLRPALDERALRFSPRVRSLLARLAGAALRKQLLTGTTPARAHYRADEELLAVLLRAARRAAPRRAP
jgi:hypothetical protein